MRREVNLSSETWATLEEMRDRFGLDSVEDVVVLATDAAVKVASLATPAEPRVRLFSWDRRREAGVDFRPQDAARRAAG